MTDLAPIVQRLDAIEHALAALRAAAMPAPEAIYLSPAQAAQRWTVSVRHVRELLRAGMPALRLGRRVRIPVVEAERWLAQRRARCHLRVVGSANRERGR